VGALIQELFHVGLYKRTQGRVTRQVTFAVLALAVVAGLWGMSQTQMMFKGGPGWLRPAWLPPELVQYGVPGLLALAGFWVAYRLVNVPAFADFLIAVEAEMNKVSWPTRTELYRSSIVVLVTIFALAIVLFGFDYFWSFFFKWLGIL
jgi:preprotein translocase subunit SecE